MLSIALEYASRGWEVFPVYTLTSDLKCTCGVKGCASPGKHPVTRTGLKEATTNQDQIRSWFEKNDYNIGIATGEASDLTVIDIDIADGKKGAESWAALIQAHGEPVTLMVRTGSGGLHLYFKHNSSLKTSADTLGEGIDVRNSGGFVVAPPSRHKSGGVYSWVDETVSLASLPHYLTKKVKKVLKPRKTALFSSKYTLRNVASMLDVIPSENRDFWRAVGIILGREYDRSDEAWEVYLSWSAKDTRKKSATQEQVMRESFYDISQQKTENDLTIATIIAEAVKKGWAPLFGSVPRENFVFFAPSNVFLYRPTLSEWIAAAVDSAVSPINEQGKILKSTEWLKKNQLCTSMTCDPLLDEDYIPGYDCREGEIVRIEGAALFNAFRRPTIDLGDKNLASPFLQHVYNVFPREGDAAQFLDYMAHRVQHPGIKPRFALLIAGDQGVGKDTAVEMCIPAIGSWNVSNISAAHLESPFNEYASSVLVRISEQATQKDLNKWSFNEAVKVLIAGSPDFVKINPKYGQKHSIRMFCGVIITTNHLLSAIYIPEDDRRYDVIEAATKTEMGLTDDASRVSYFESLWDWYKKGGDTHIAAFLHHRDLSNFSAENGQRKTSAHRAVVCQSYTSDEWLIDILDEKGDPSIITTLEILDKMDEAAKKKPGKIQPALLRKGYRVVHNPDRGDGRWRFHGKVFKVFSLNEDCSSEEIEAHTKKILY
jgi:putative DNA primase/helicase